MKVLQPTDMVECRACEGRGSHSRTVLMTSNPRATCDLETWPCGLCKGTGQTTLKDAQEWDTRRSM